MHGQGTFKWQEEEGKIVYTGKWVNGEAIKGFMNHPDGPVEKVSDEPVRNQ